MKGIIFKLLEQVVVAEHGDDAWDEMLDATQLDGVYTSLGSYPDEHLGLLVGAAATRFDTDASSIIRWFGRSAIPLLAATHNEFFAGHDGTVAFLLTLNEIIHAEVRKIYPEADVPEFGFRLQEGGIDLEYVSARKLCALAEGFVEGTAAHYGESVVLTQPECLLRGDQRCLIQCRFAAA